MVGRNGVGVFDAVAVERVVSAVLQPHQFIPAPGSIDQHLLVVAAQADDPFRLPLLLHLHEKVDHVPASTSAVDVIADEDKAGRARLDELFAMLHQVGELGVAAVNVADRIGESARHPVFPRKRFAHQ